MHLDYDLSNVPVSPQTLFAGVTNPQTSMQYHQVEMQVVITVRQAAAKIEVVWGREEGTWGTPGAAGFTLTSQTLEFPEISAGTGYEQ